MLRLVRTCCICVSPPQLVFGRSRNLLAMEANNILESKRARCNESKTIGTHSGTFHCDEVLGCFMLRQLPEYEDAQIFRSRNDDELNEKCDIILDVGGQFDHEKKMYDHHQNSFKETLSSLRPEVGNEFNIKLSSAGLIYTFYGERIIESILQRHANVKLSEENLRLCFIQIYRNFVSEIDAIDNGVPICPPEAQVYRISTHISARIQKLNPSWDEENVDVEQRFSQAMATVGKEFVENVLHMGKSWINAREYVRQSLKGAKTLYETGEILLLEPFCPWKSHLADLEIEYKVQGVPKVVIFRENEHSWRVAGVPIAPNSFVGRKFLPVPWRGLRGEQLSKVAEIPDLNFVHHTGFIGGALNKEAALKMAIKSVQWKEN